MKSFYYTVKDFAGLHARPVGKIVSETQKYKSKIIIQKDDKTIADAKKILEIMKLNIKFNQNITVIINGIDEDIAIQNLEKFFNKNKL